MKTKISLLLLSCMLWLTQAKAYVTIDSVHVTNASSCMVCNGTATAAVSNGTTPYTYYWSTGQTTSSISGLCAGSYMLVVQDAIGDTTAAFFNVGPTPLSDSAMNSSAAGCSGNSGTATMWATGGTLPYTYLWSNAGTTATISGLTAGNYSVTVTDAGGCTVTGSISVIAGGLTPYASETDVTCNGGNNGSATVTIVYGGTGPYTYSWSPSGGTNVTASNLSAGTYTVTVTDNTGCTGTTSVTINQPSPLVADSSGNIFINQQPTCSNNNGSAYVFAVGGTYPYTYNWTPSGGTNNYATGLSAGTYTVTVTDANGCTATASGTLTASGPIPSVSSTEPTCYGQSDGSLSITSVTGGSAPYTYLWSPGGATTTSITGLTSGTYSVTVTDKNGCTGTTPVYLNQPGPLSFVADTVGDTGSCSGSANIYVSGGTYPYTFTWSTSVHAVDSFGMETADSLCPGAYLLCVTDANGCSTCDSVHIKHHKPKVMGIADINSNAGNITIYPNPSSGQFRLSLSNITQGQKAEVDVTNVLGEVIYKTGIEISSGEYVKDISLQNASPGVYFVRVTTGSKVYTTKLVIEK